MFVYEEDNQSHSMFAWNAVDVLIDGLLQLGKVINVVEKGLIINFGCTGQGSEFIEYEHIFHATRVFDPLDTFLDPNVQVLLRVGPDCPWKWYPGIVLSPGDEGGYLAGLFIVEAQLPHGTVRELLPRNQVRRPPSDADLDGRRVQDKDFVIRSCPMPSAWTGETGLLREIFPLILPRARGVFNTMVQSDSLQYLQRGSDRALLPDELEELFNRTKKKFYKCAIPQDVWLQTSLWHKVLRDRKRYTFPFLEPDESIPSKLLVEIFQSLDSGNRTRCRRTCTLWNNLLTTEDDFPDVRVSGRQDDCPSPGMQPVFWIMTCLLHCVNRRTKTMVLMHMTLDDCEDAAAMVRFVVGRTGTLVFYRCALHFTDAYMGIHSVTPSIKDIVGCLVRMCRSAERVEWIRCRLADPYMSAEVAHNALPYQPADQLERQLWDLFEANLVVEKAVDLKRLSQWIDHALGCARCNPFDQLKRILCSYQSVDPRCSSHLRGC
ncbi:uncharacterized protein LOC129599072 isoform X2 [Paramacrobiotus metropolitanus]|uniref:uncharacterized protein LOC129599072 isoform X2 n=1 Tax=Paramacrobiotus metropolitanus TaxID=2943436 RepID=UPI0024459CF5|nr:uncharacterized protein LOC129599072 isoform X2 [Paramacrobiotus metropolitanus]